MEREAHSRPSSVDDSVRLINAQSSCSSSCRFREMTTLEIGARLENCQRMFIIHRRQGVLAVTQKAVEAIKQLTKADSD
jgi:hypothetical protein